MYKHLEICTVKIESSTGILKGTGFFIAKNIILTCYHVINSDSSCKIVWKNEAYNIEILEEKEEFDLVLLSVNTNNEDSVFIDKTISIRDNCYAFGFPNNDEENKAKASGLESDTDGMTFEVVFDDNKTVKFKGEQFKEGFSGSPVLNEKTGAVCSIVTISREPDEIKGGFGISFEKLSEFSDLEYNNEDDIKNWISDGTKPDKADITVKEYHLTIECEMLPNGEFKVYILTQHDNKMKKMDDKETYTKNEIAILVDNYVQENKPSHIEEWDVYLLFVLPISLMSENISSWKTGEDMLGERYTIMLRGQERFRKKDKNEYNSFFNIWESNWNKCIEKEGEPIKNIIYKKNDDTLIISQRIKEKPLMVFGYNIDSKMFKKLYRRGISRAIWVGKDANFKEFKKLFKNKEYKKIEFGKLHNNLCKFKEKEKKIGSHIMFLYDNPNEMPIDNSDMAQINPIL